MKLRRGLGLRWQLLVSLAFFFVVTVVLVSLAMLSVTQRAMVRQAQRSVETQAEVASTTMAAAIDLRAALRSEANADTLARLCRLFGEPYDGGHVAAFERDEDGWRVLATYPPAQGARGEVPAESRAALDAGEIYSAVQSAQGVQQLDVLAPIILDGAVIAAVRLEIPLVDVQQRIAAAQQAIVLYVLLDALLLFFIGYALLTRGFVRPIAVISAATERVANGEFDARLSVVARNELGDLARNFERMVERLQDGRADIRTRLDQLAEANEQLAAAQQEVVRSEKLATIGTLAAGIAHEIGNPLAAVVGLLDLLQDRGQLEDADVDDLLRRIAAEIDRIHHIVRGLLDYARVTEETDGPTHVAGPIDQAVALAAHHPRARNLKVEIDLDEELPPVKIGEGRLVQVLLNLLVNAGDAAGAEPGVVSIRGWMAEPSSTSFVAGTFGVRLDITDGGPGIDAELIDRIFDPFVTTKAPGEGTGLGLAICDRIVTNAGGRMTVRSTPGEGATFTLWLPVASLHAFEAG